HLLTKIHDHSATVAIIGLGYVGLPLAVAFAESGLRVIGIDIDPSKVDVINQGRSYISDIPSERLVPLVHHSPFTDSPIHQSSPRLTATTDYSVLAGCDVAIICVPTPLNKTRDPDVRYLIAAGESVARFIHPGMLVVLESTTYHGTTEELLRPMLEEGIRGQSLEVRGAKEQTAQVGVNFFLAFSPERIDPGRTDWTVENTPKVIGGVTPQCLEAAMALYSQAITRVVPVSSPAAAEMTKLLENTFRAVNIALVNEVAIMCDKLGIDVWEVIDAAATKPYGFMKFTPGPGVGGHCIPLDPHYLSWKLKTLNYNARFIQLAGEINSDMPRYWVEKVVDALNQAGKPLKGSNVLVLGVAYKKDIDDVRESPALDIIELLRQKGADVRYHDPYVAQFAHNGHGLRSEAELDPALRAADCVVIVTDHSVYDWPHVNQMATALVDTRNIVNQASW
ncbi:MAG TPA: nucleotide sugar dehydrogenase, partial [Anaerolineae bacterium]|nr:nucleotide sugar dehydrogenase [Anaerolineae bacterium]